MTLKTQVAKGLKWQAINIIGKQVISLVVFTTFARLLDPESFGLMSLVGIYLGFIRMFVDQGISAALIQRQDLKQEHLDAVFWFNVTCAFLIAGGTFVFADYVSAILGEPKLAPLLRWSSLGLLLSPTAAIHATLLVKAMDFRRTVLRLLIANVAGGIIGIGMAFAGFGVWALVADETAAMLASVIFLWVGSTYRPTLRFSFAHLRELFGVSSSVFITSLLGYFSSQLDQLIIGRFAGVPTLGLYVIAKKIPNTARSVTGEPLAQISLPALSRLQDDHKRVSEVIYSGMELNATVSFAIYAGVAAISTDLVPFLFGEKWAAASWISAMLSINALISVLQVFVHPALLASGGTGRYVFLNAWAIIGNTLACVIGIQFGVSYVIFGLILNNLIMSVLSMLFLQKRIGLNAFAYWRPCFIPALASIAMGLVIWGTTAILPAETIPVVRIVCKVAVGAIAYLGCVYALAPSTLIRLWEMVGHAFRRTTNLSTGSPTF